MAGAMSMLGFRNGIADYSRTRAMARAVGAGECPERTLADRPISRFDPAGQKTPSLVRLWSALPRDRATVNVAQDSRRAQTGCSTRLPG